jgi:hypothetical protein
MARKIICPLFRKPCIEHECAWWTTVRGRDVNTGQDLDQQMCVFTTLPFLLIENSAQQRSTGAAVESLRNESVKNTDTTNTLLANLVVQSQVAVLPQASFTDVAELPPSKD